jgi:hypothetical protein
VSGGAENDSREGLWPAVDGEIDSPMSVEGDPLGFKHRTLNSLEGGASSACAHFPPGVDDPMPGHVVIVGKCGHRVADLPRSPAQTSLEGHCAVGRDSAARNSPDDVVELIVGRHFQHAGSVGPAWQTEGRPPPKPEIMSMPDPRYPIGPFESVGRPLTDTERDAYIGAIAEHPSRMREAVADLSDEQLDTRYRAGGWTLRQVVHHVVDSHVNSYVRFKLAVSEKNPTVCTYDEAAWAEFGDAREDPVEGSLAMLDALHGRWVSFLKRLGPEDFSRSVRYPEVGDITVDVLLEIYGWHCPHHEGHITRLRGQRNW